MSDENRETLLKLHKFLTDFNLGLDTSMEALGLDKKKIKEYKKKLKEFYPDLEFDEVKNTIQKKIIFRNVNNNICNLVSEYEKIKNFIENKNQKFLLVIGRINSGKTILINRVLEDLNMYNEYVFVLKDFIADETYNTRFDFDVVFIIDNFDDINLYWTKKRKFKQVLKKKDSRNKLIITARKIDDFEDDLFDTVVRIKDIPFDAVFDFLMKNRADLIHDDKDKIRGMYLECQRDIFHFIEYLEKGYHTYRRKIDSEQECKCLTKMIFRDENRSEVFGYLHRVLEKNYIKKIDEETKVKYFDELEFYLKMNILVFFDPESDDYYHNLRILDYIYANKTWISKFKIINLLTSGIRLSSIENNAIKPYTSGFQKKYIKKKKKR